MARPNLPALLLSALLVGGMLAGLLAGTDIPRIFGGVGGSADSGLRQPSPPAACRMRARETRGGYRFTPRCAGQAPSPDGRWLVVKNGETGTGIGIVRASDGASLADLGMLDDGRPFTLHWAPDGTGFFVNRPPGTPAGGVRVFRHAGGTLAERRELVAAATRIVAGHPACAQNRSERLDGVAWTGPDMLTLRDGGPDAPCLLLSGNVDSGRIDPASIRTLAPQRPPTP